MTGYIKVITGGMFSGKTEELISYVRRAPYANDTAQVFKASVDTRYDEDYVVAHHQSSIAALPVVSSRQLLERVQMNCTTLVAIDETQFFDDDIVEVCEALANRGIGVVAAGLDTDFRGEPFGPMPNLMAVAEEVIKKQAYCAICGNPASRSQRLIDGHPAHYDSPITMIGGSEKYEARCRAHHVVPGRPEIYDR